MRILVDAHHLGNRQTGNETWTRNVVRELAKHPGDDEIDFAVTPAGASVLHALVGVRGHLVHANSARRLGVDLPRLLRQVRADAVLVQYTVPVTTVPAAVLIHDLSFEEAAARHWLPPATLYRLRATVRWSCRRATQVLTVSEHARQSLISTYGLSPDKVSVAGNAVDPALQAALGRARPEPHSAYRVLVVGNVVPRKNIEIVARAVRLLRDDGNDVELRVVGSTDRSEPRLLASVRRLLAPPSPSLVTSVTINLRSSTCRRTCSVIPACTRGSESLPSKRWRRAFPL